MKTTTPKSPSALRVLSVILCLACAPALRADLLIHLPFNEGSGTTTHDLAGGFVGILGAPLDPAVDTVTLLDTAPSGQPGDRCITNSGGGFLIADDSAQRVLDITNGPITMEAWIYIDPYTPAKSAEGIVGYGGSYKMGMKGGWQVFTLFGKVDITNTAAGPVPAGSWVHLAAAWEPGAGVHFYMNGVHQFEPDTNITTRPLQNTYLGLGSEGLANNAVAALDRIRIHHALLTESEIDSDPLNPKALTANTIVSYDFNEAALPCLNAKSPSLPAVHAAQVVNDLYSPVWTNDTPTGRPDDFALAFVTEAPLVKEYVTVNYSAAPIDLGINNTNYTLQAWVKLPTGPFEERRVIFYTGGAAPRVSLSINANRALHTTLYGNTDFASSVFVPNDNRWHHVAAVMENFARVRFYLDGVLRQTMNRTATAAPSSSATPVLTVGKESETRYFRGLLDRVLIHNNALSAAELDFPAISGLATFPSPDAHPTDVVTNLGATVAFVAQPSSPTPAAYQWHYRTNLADHSSVPVPGATNTTLVLTDIRPADLGYYFLVVSNTAGVSESYAARLSVTPDLSAKLFDFEPPTYVSGLLEGQDAWRNDQNGNAVRVRTAEEISTALAAAGLPVGTPVHGGGQALMVSGGGVATTTLRTITGLETESRVTLEVWVRPLAAGNTGAAIGNTFLTMENASGTRAAAFRLGPSNSLDYGSTNSGVWVATGQTWNENEWYRITMRLNYANRTYDFLINGTQVNAAPIPFYNLNSESFRQIRIFRGANQAGAIFDDLWVTGPSRPQITSITAAAGTVTIKWEGGQPPYQVQRRPALTEGGWENLGAPTTANQATDAMGAAAMFYRVLGN